MPRTLLLLLLGIALLAASCQHTPTPEEQATIDGIQNNRRPASLAAWQGKRIRGVDATAFAGPVTALVLPPHASLKMKQVRMPDGRLILRLTARGKDLFCGSAVPITSDGYFLTAAHNLEAVPGLTLLVPMQIGPVGKGSAKIVW